MEKMEFLENYRWSSFPDYIENRQCQTIPLLGIPSVTQREFLLSTFKERGGYKKDVEEWLKEKSMEDFNLIQDVLLDDVL